MNSELLIGPSPKKALLLLVISSAFVAIGIAMRQELPLEGWLAVALFGLGIPISLSLLLPQLTYIKLDEFGFEVCTLGRKHKTAWSHITNLQLVSIHSNKMVGFNYAPSFDRMKAGRALASAFSGVEGAIPSHYKVGAEQLLEIMLAWHHRYGKHAI